MADWSKPTITSNYVTFVDEVKARDFDAITLQLNAVTNPPFGAIRLVRSPVVFQEWTDIGWVDKVISMQGGGTGSSTPAGARTALQLGDMSLQNSNNVTITGGILQSMYMQGNIVFNGGTFSFASPANQEAINVTAAANKYGIYVSGSAVANQSYGVIIRAGTMRSDAAFSVENSGPTLGGMYITGDMVVICPNRLVIPVGVDRWA